MAVFRACVVGGWCGNRMVIVAEHLTQVLKEAGYPCKIITHSVWENYSQPPTADVVLQLLPAFTEKETGCPVVNIKPLLLDLNHPDTIQKVIDIVRACYPQPVDVLHLPVASLAR